MQFLPALKYGVSLLNQSLSLSMKIKKDNKYLVYSKNTGKYAVAPALYVEMYIKDHQLKPAEFAQACGVKYEELQSWLETPKPFSQHICKCLFKGTGISRYAWQDLSSKYLLDLAEINMEGNVNEENNN